MKLFGGRVQISGYVTPSSKEKIVRAAEGRKVSVATLVAASAEWFADYLATHGTPPPALGEIGLPLLPDLHGAEPTSLAPFEASQEALLTLQAKVQTPTISTPSSAPALEPSRWRRQQAPQTKRRTATK